MMGFVTEKISEEDWQHYIEPSLKRIPHGRHLIKSMMWTIDREGSSIFLHVKGNGPDPDAPDDCLFYYKGYWVPVYVHCPRNWSGQDTEKHWKWRLETQLYPEQYPEMIEILKEAIMAHVADKIKRLISYKNMTVTITLDGIKPKNYEGVTHAIYR